MLVLDLLCICDVGVKYKPDNTGKLHLISRLSTLNVPRQHVVAALAVSNVQDLLSMCLEQQQMSKRPTWKFLLAEAGKKNRQVGDFRSTEL